MSRLKIHEKDNVAVCLQAEGSIPAGHKVALRDIPEGEYVIKYGHIIGRATRNIAAGDWVHSHNLCSHLDETPEYSYHFRANSFPPAEQTFEGFVRKGRRAGIRNEIYIIPSVGCVNGVCNRLAKQAQQLISGSVDGVYALTHPFGCSQLGQDQENIKHLLSAIALNPNATFVLFVGLGCENNGLGGIKECLENTPNEHIFYLGCQDVEDEHAAGMAMLEKMLKEASALKRERVPLSQLCLGLKCGGTSVRTALPPQATRRSQIRPTRGLAVRPE